jgi:hypothetical protein
MQYIFVLNQEKNLTNNTFDPVFSFYYLICSRLPQKKFVGTVVYHDI